MEISPLVVKKHDSFIGVWDKLASQQQCERMCGMIDEMLSNTVNPFNTEVNDGEAPLLRVDECLYAEELNPEVYRYFNHLLMQMIESYKKHYHTLSSISEFASTHVKLQRTKPRGGYHKWHCEQVNVDTSRRVMAWMIYLNDMPEGEAETEFLWQGVKLQPKAGRGCIWPAAWTHAHRGNTVYTQNKYIATGWFYLIK
tara:strand:- start:71 stop:664 length:594 start_codon:yes stop_codon:yes gene_type:complete